MAVIVTSFICLFILGTVGFIVVGLPVLKLVKPGTIVSVPVLLGLFLYQFMLKYRNCYTSYFSCTNRIIYVNGFVVSAILCVFFSFILIGPLQFGVWGLIAAQIFSQGVYNFWHWPMLAHKELNLRSGEMICMGISEFRRKFLKLLQKR